MTRVRNILLAIVVMTAIAAVLIVGKGRVNADDTRGAQPASETR